MINRYITRINVDGITNLLIKYVEATRSTEFTEKEKEGVIKFLVYLMDEWESEIDGN